MNKIIIFSGLLSLLCVEPYSSLAMKRDRNEGIQEVKEVMLIKVPEKKRKVEEFQEHRIRPLQNNSPRSLRAIAAYAFLSHAFKDGKINIIKAFENIPSEVIAYMADLGLVGNQTLLYKVSTAEEIDFLIQNGARIIFQRECEQPSGEIKITFYSPTDDDLDSPLVSLALQGKEGPVRALLKHMQKNERYVQAFFDNDCRYTDDRENNKVEDFFEAICSRGLISLAPEAYKLASSEVKKLLSRPYMFFYESLESIYQCSSIESLGEMIDQGKDFNLNKIGITPFNLFILRGDLKLASMLLDRLGTTLDITTPDKITRKTPLMNAITQGYIDLAAKIIRTIVAQNKVDELAKEDIYIREAGMFALKNAPELVTLILENCPKADTKWIIFEILEYPFTEHYCDILDYILDNKKYKDINKETCDKENFLMWAVRESCERTITKLAQCGAQVNFQIHNKTALLCAVANSVESVEMLLNLGADINFVTQDNNSALREAIRLYLKREEQYIKDLPKYAVARSEYYKRFFEEKIDIQAKIIKFLLNKGALVTKSEVEIFDNLVAKYNLNPEKVVSVRNLLIEKMQQQT